MLLAPILSHTRLPTRLPAVTPPPPKPQVFRPSHILPTLTVEQQGEIEVAEAMQRQQHEQKAEAARRRQQAERRSDDEDEEEVQRARAWDDYKDANPYGSGNSKLRPCS